MSAVPGFRVPSAQEMLRQSHRCYNARSKNEEEGHDKILRVVG